MDVDIFGGSLGTLGIVLAWVMVAAAFVGLFFRALAEMRAARREEQETPLEIGN